MKPLTKKNRVRLSVLTDWLRKWRWLILFVIGASLLWVEIQEFLVLRILNQSFHYFEAVQYAILLISTGVLIELFARSDRGHKQVVKIIEHKHRLSMELASAGEWNTLLDKLSELPAKLVDVEETYLLLDNPANESWDVVSHWTKNRDERQALIWNPMIPCQKCLEKVNGKKVTFHLCRYDDEFPFNTYSLALINHSFPATILKFRLGLGARLSEDEEEIFNNIGDEIFIALQASQDHKRLTEMQSAEAAMAERRAVSAYVHDQLAQNLGYLHLKLDQLVTNKEFEYPRTKKDFL